ncbi:MAG: hypothetical protein H7X86_14350 [Gorillibacterium sp.]|nr:hypothetical protein [Gorillibacterium sp.]
MMSRLKLLLEAHPEWIAPRSDEHTVIGVANTRDHRKTFVEPGGSFSPGVATFGVSVWVYDHDAAKLYAPEIMAREELIWSWDKGYLPIVNSGWSADQVEVEQQLLADSVKGLEHIVNSLQVRVKNGGKAQRKCTIYIVIRPYGPAGGGIRVLGGEAYDAKEVLIDNRVILLAKTPANRFGAVSYSQHGQEISVPLRSGHLPSDCSVWDEDWSRPGCCSGALAYEVLLQPGEQQVYEFDFYVHPVEHDYMESFRAYHARSFETKLAKVRGDWEKVLRQTDLEVPDERFRNAYYSTLAQFLIAAVDHEPRIATITYPLFWLRDGVYIINALDKAGLHDEARLQLDKLKDYLFAGGFGAEPDAFGEAIWPFLTHYRLTGDKAWLQEIYPFISHRADWIIRCRHTTEYLYDDVEMRVPDQRNSAQTDLICEPAKDGLIIGRMDWHRPIIWINAFSYLGLQAVAEMAEDLGLTEDSAHYAAEAEDLKEALKRYALINFGDNERDTVCAIWPTRAFSTDSAHVLENMEKWWQQVRLQGKGEYKAEPLWKYFELGQAHNYLWVGDRDKVWLSVDHYLEHHDVKGLYGWLEDNHDIVEFWSRIEGWYKLPSRQPHGWVSSEFFLLLRDMLAYEQGQTLVIGEGIPAAWMAEQRPLHVLRLPTHFGPVDVEIAHQTDEELTISIHFHNKERLPEFIDLRLPWAEEELITSIGFKQADDVRVPRIQYQDRCEIKVIIQLS